MNIKLNIIEINNRYVVFKDSYSDSYIIYGNSNYDNVLSWSIEYAESYSEFYQCQVDIEHNFVKYCVYRNGELKNEKY